MKRVNKMKINFQEQQSDGLEEELICSNLIQNTEPSNNLGSTLKQLNGLAEKVSLFSKFQDSLKSTHELKSTITNYIDATWNVSEFLNLQDSLKSTHELKSTFTNYVDATRKVSEFLNLQDSLKSTHELNSTFTNVPDASCKVVGLGGIKTALKPSITVVSFYKQYTESMEAAITLRKLEADIRREQEELYLSFRDYELWEDRQEFYSNDIYHTFRDGVRCIYENIFYLQDNLLSKLNKEIVRYEKLLNNIVLKNRKTDKRKSIQSQMRFAFKNLDDTHSDADLFTNKINQIQTLKDHQKWKSMRRRQAA